MHPTRPPQSPTARRRTPSNDHNIHPGGHHTSLPSIRQLHPYLPPSAMAQQLMSTGDLYSYPPPPAHYPPQQSSSHLSGTQRESESYGGADSEGEEGDQGPPKKKRRRQALSCTGEPAHRVSWRLLTFAYVILVHSTAS